MISYPHLFLWSDHAFIGPARTRNCVRNKGIQFNHDPLEGSADECIKKEYIFVFPSPQMFTQELSAAMNRCAPSSSPSTASSSIFASLPSRLMEKAKQIDSATLLAEILAPVTSASDEHAVRDDHKTVDGKSSLLTGAQLRRKASDLSNRLEGESNKV